MLYIFFISVGCEKSKKPPLKPVPTQWERSLLKTLWEKEKFLVRAISPFPTMFSSLSDRNYNFLAPLAEGQRAIVMALCPSCAPQFIRLSVRPCVCARIRKLLLQKTSPQKLLTGFLWNFTGMFLRWSSFKFLQIQSNLYTSKFGGHS